MALTEVNSLGLKDLEVKTGDIAADAITGAKIADDAIDSEHYTNASIDHAHLANDCVDGDNIADDAINSEHYVDASIDHQHLADDCVDGDNIADNSVGLAALAHGTDGNLITFDASGAPAYVATGNDGQVLTSTGAGSPPAFETISTSDTLSHRNVIINGEMKINQRQATSSITGASYGGPDRWQVFPNNIGTYAVTQDTGPTAEGFNSCLRLDCSTADASPAANDFLQLQTKIEGQDLYRFKWGQSGSKATTLSFWCKANINGWSSGTKTFIVEIAVGNSKKINNQVSLSTNNTWQKIEINLPVNTVGGPSNSGNGTGCWVSMWLGAGTTYSSGTFVSNQWVTVTNANRAAGLDLNLNAHTDNKFYLTGVQLEEGTSATEFEYRTFDEELRRCQRYYFMQEGDDGDWMAPSFAQDSSDMYFFFNFPVPMRTVPSYTAADVNVRHYSADASDAFGAHGLAVSNQNTTYYYGSGCTNTVLYKSGASITAGQGGLMQCQANGVKLQFSAEL